MVTAIIWITGFILSVATTLALDLNAAGGFFCGVSWGVVTLLIESKIK